MRSGNFDHRGAERNHGNHDAGGDPSIAGFKDKRNDRRNHAPQHARGSMQAHRPPAQTAQPKYDDASFGMLLEMGFHQNQARAALSECDNLDAAVEWLVVHGTVRARLCHTIFPIFLPHFRLCEVVSLHTCVLPYKYRKILEMLLKLMKLCKLMGSRTSTRTTL